MVLTIDRTKNSPLYIQIKEGIKALIQNGTLKAHEKLSPTRELATSLGVSRNSVIQAYSLLEAEGLIYSSTGRGTFVYPDIHVSKIGARNNKTISMSFEGLFSISWKQYESSVFSNLSNLLKPKKDDDFIAFSSDNPDEKEFPLEDFKSSLLSSLNRYKAVLLSTDSSQGFYPLREVLAERMAHRGIHTTPENIVITSGIQQSLSLIARLFLDPGDTVLLEHFTYPGALAVFRSLQAHCIGIPTDREGIQLDIVKKVLKRKKVKLLYTIPTYHNPLGVVLSLERRRQLTELSRLYEFIIVEDDYAHELSFNGKEEIPLKAFDKHGGVFYMGSFSETLFPGIRLSWIVTPPLLSQRLASLKTSSDLYTNLILQAAVLEFVQRGLFDRLIKKRRALLAHRSRVVDYALTRYLPEKVKWIKPKGGMYQWVELPETIDSLDLLVEARDKGILFAPDRLFAVEEWGKGGFRIGFAPVHEEKIWRGIETLSTIIKHNL